MVSGAQPARPPRRWTGGALVAGLLALAALFPAAAQEPGPVENRDYVVIPDGKPWQPLDGRIEVVEVFSYGCIHCFNLQRLIDPWQRRQPSDVRLSYLPAVFSASDSFARGFFAARSLGLEDGHHAMFSAVHEQGRLPRSGASVEAVAAVYADRPGAPPAARLVAAMGSPEVDKQMNAARNFAARSGVEGTPTLIINGRYRVTGRSLEHTLAVADQLIARERGPR